MTIPKSAYVKGAAAAGAYFLGGKVGKLAGLALAGWAAWDIFGPQTAAPAAVATQAGMQALASGDAGGPYLPATWDAANHAG